MDVPSPERCSRLTAHKAFPKRRVVSDGSSSDDLLQARPRRSYTSPTREARITSWIRDASPNLPLTPPDDVENAATAEANGLQEEDRAAVQTFLLDPFNETSGSTTPVNHQSPPPQSASIIHRSPPTPQMTPPKKTRERKRSPSPPLRRRKRTSLSPPPTSRQTSSKAESFRTAAEQLSSPSPAPDSAGFKAPVLTFHSPSPPRETVSRKQNTDSVGLGIGYLNDDRTGTPTEDRPMTLLGGSPQPELVARSGPTSPATVHADPVVAAEPSAVAQLSHGRGMLEPSNDEAEFSGFSYINEDDTPYKERPFFDGYARDEGDFAPSDESKRSVSPLSDELDEEEAFLAKAQRDSKRVSQISNLSMLQPVEVLLIDHGPVTPPKLRHAGKVPSLRTASSSKGESARSSLQSNNDYKPRLNRMLGRLPDTTADSSLFSDSGISMVGSDHIMKRWSKLAVADLPRRPSMTHSLQHHASPKHHSLFTNSSESRPATAPSGPDASPELRSMRKRTISTASSNSRGRGRDKGVDRDRPPITGRPPVVPMRTSSLGAPTSRDASMSRAESSNVTAESGKTPGHGRSVSQPMAQAQNTRSGPPVRPEAGSQPATETQTTTRMIIRPDPESYTRQTAHQSNASTVPPTPVITLSPTSVDDVSSTIMPQWARSSSETSESNGPMTATGTLRRNSKEDAALLASRALLKTPFSGHSVQSSLSGAYEVHEATAINIYPHTNSSLLVIQQAVSNVVHFPAHPGVRPGAYRVTEVSSPTSTIRAQQPESMHVKIEGPDSPSSPRRESRNDSPTLPYDSPLRNPRPAPKAPTSETGTLPSVNLIPPTPLDITSAGQRPGSNGKAALVNGPVSLVRRALSSNAWSSAGTMPRTSGLWLGSGRKYANGGVKKKRSRPMIKDDNLSPFWRPKKFWDDEEDYADDTADRGAASSNYKHDITRGNAAQHDYFSQPVRNTLGFPQSRIVIPGPASLVRRLSSIRRYRSLKRKKFPPSAQPARPLSPSSPARPAPKPSSTQRSSSLPRGISSVSPVRVISPTPSAMARRRRSQKRSVRFEFNPMRGLSGSSGETPGWATRAMRKRGEKKAAKRREELKGTIGQPKLETVFE